MDVLTVQLKYVILISYRPEGIAAKQLIALKTVIYYEKFE